MFRPRVIPCLLLRGGGLVKTVQFKNPTYLGDPINIVKLFNDKKADELILLDITATVEKKKPQWDLLAKIADQCFMPLCYGGGIQSLEDMKTLFNLGIEKVAVNTHAVENPEFIQAAADRFGNQSIVISMDIKKNLFGRYELFTCGGKKSTKLNPVQFAIKSERLGAGELLVNSIDRDGTLQGYDLDLIRKISESVSIPVIACGGARTVQDLAEVVTRAGASAAAASSMFVFQGPHQAVLISFPTRELEEIFSRDQ